MVRKREYPLLLNTACDIKRGEVSKNLADYFRVRHLVTETLHFVLYYTPFKGPLQLNCRNIIVINRLIILQFVDITWGALYFETSTLYQC